jgi:GT2 family glycosyltransferase
MTVARATSRRRSADWARAPLESTEPVIDVLIPTAGRLTELAVTLSGLAAQDEPAFRVIISDQSDNGVAAGDPSVSALVRVLAVQGRNPMLVRHLPRRGLAEHRQFLLGCSSARYVLFLDDDVWLEPGSLERLYDAIERLRCGFVGSAVQGLSYLGDERPAELVSFEPWQGDVLPERIRRGSPGFERWPLHNAANLTHLAAQLRLEAAEWLAYRVAWIGGCVLYNRQSLVECGGFDFWHGLPELHSGEDVAAQWRVMERFGGAGVLPSGAVHLEAPTTIPDREVDAFDVVFASEPRAPS